MWDPGVLLHISYLLHDYMGPIHTYTPLAYNMVFGKASSATGIALALGTIAA